jgi:hypothetical protein
MLALRALPPPRGWAGVGIALGAAIAAAVAALAAALAMLPPVLVFPVMATALILAAAAMGLIACAAPPETGTTRTFCWDVAGLLALVGLAAALFGEGEQAVALLRREEA